MAKDNFHDNVKEALIKDNWSIIKIFFSHLKPITMKSIVYFFSFVLLSSMTLKNDIEPGDPFQALT